MIRQLKPLKIRSEIRPLELTVTLPSRCVSDTPDRLMFALVPSSFNRTRRRYTKPIHSRYRANVLTR